MVGFVLFVMSVVLPVQETVPTHGWVEFSRDETSRVFHSIKVFIVLDEKNRLQYVDEIGTHGSRTLTLRAPAGTVDFVVVVQPTGGDRTSVGAPTDPVRRTRSNVKVEVEPGKLTPVTIGGFTDFDRRDPFGRKFVRPSDDPEASHFQTRIIVGKPTSIEKKGRQ